MDIFSNQRQPKLKNKMRVNLLKIRKEKHIQPITIKSGPTQFVDPWREADQV